MFTECICESTWGDPARRCWATLASFAVQAFGLGVLLIAPLLYTTGIPSLRFFTPALLIPPSAPPPVLPHSSLAHGSISNLNAQGMPITPRVVPTTIALIHDQAGPPPIPDAGIGVLGGTAERSSGGTIPGAIANLGIGISPPLPKPIAPLPRTSHMMEGLLVHRVQPEYPPLARMARVQGEVVLRAVISKAGTIEKLEVVDGHPMLARAAADAVRQWRYRPYILNSEPVEVETEITVNFVLSGG